jgi:DNA relaxase NicK
VYVDDFLRVVSPSDVYVECERGNLSGFRLFRADSPRKMTIGQSVKVGDAVVLGRRGKQGAGKYLRVYDKNLETLGQRDCVRWEVEFSDKRARAVMHRLTMAEGVEEFGALCGSLVGGSVEFYDRAGSQERHLERLQRVEWWQRLLDRIGWLRVRAARRFSSVGRVAAWVTSQVAASLAMLTEVCGGDAWTYLGEVVRQGQQRMSGRHRKMIRAYLSECDQGSLLAEVA